MSDRAAQLSPCGVLHDEADRAVAECRRHSLGVRIPRHHEDCRRRGRLAEAPYHIEPVKPGQRHLHKENGWPEAPNHPDRLEAIRHLPDDLEVLLALEQASETLTDRMLSIGHHDRDHWPRTPCLYHSCGLSPSSREDDCCRGAALASRSGFRLGRAPRGCLFVATTQSATVYTRPVVV